MELWTAFLLGFAGSAHCAGMCGPLVIALPRGPDTSTGRLVAGRLVYNLGRVVTYGVLGVVFGVVGRSLALAGFQRWVSIALGLLLLVGLVVSRKWSLEVPGLMALAPFRALFGRLLRSRSLAALGTLGALNGLLPCGLVYVACLAAAATGGVLPAVAYMLVFGLGTFPMMFGLALAGGALPVRTRVRLQKLIPASLALVAGLLILRGLSLGIPYLSPDLSAACH